MMGFPRASHIYTVCKASFIAIKVSVQRNSTSNVQLSCMSNYTKLKLLKHLILHVFPICTTKQSSLPSNPLLYIQPKACLLHD